MLIVDMKMPERCGACPCRHVEFDIDRVAVFCALLDNEFVEDPDSIPTWCPIKGVLPDEHGDLIDRDVSIQTFKCIEEAPYSGFDGQEAFYAPEDVVATLLCQDVVIAAERKDDER